MTKYQLVAAFHNKSTLRELARTLKARSDRNAAILKTAKTTSLPYAQEIWKKLTQARQQHSDSITSNKLFIKVSLHHLQV